MSFDWTSLLPHGVIGTMVAGVAYIFRQHTKQDDDRYEQISEGLEKLGAKIDNVNDKAAERHTALVNTLLLKKE